MANNGATRTAGRLKKEKKTEFPVHKNGTIRMSELTPNADLKKEVYSEIYLK